jgi:hypothetical protein
MDANLKQQDADKVLEEYYELKIAGGKDDELLARARTCADEIHREMAAKYGHRKIAVELIRQARDEE